MTVLITGANRGIGLALAQHYAKAGQSVIGTHRGEVAPKVEGPNVEGIQWQRLDVADPNSHLSLAKRLNARSIDLLVCNAGVYLEKSDNTYAAEVWAATFAVNVTGVYLSIEHALPSLKKSKGKIAIISSNMASDTRAPGGSYVYRASKAAVLNLGRNLAADLKSQGVAVGIYHPGWVTTDMGGPQASINTDESAIGLLKRFEALNLANTGCFEGYDGEKLAY